MFDTLLEAEAETLDDNLCNVKVWGLVETLVDTLEEAENDTLRCGGQGNSRHVGLDAFRGGGRKS